MTENKGTLRHKPTGKTIEDVVMTEEGRGSFDVRLAKSAGVNTFFTGEWEFIPDRVPEVLPRNAVVKADGYLPTLIINEAVYQTTFGRDGGYEIQKRDKDHVLDRLRQGSAVILVNGKLVDKEVYL